MDDQVIAYLSTRIKASYRAITKGMAPNDEDDCVQECLLHYVEFGAGKLIEYAVIDFLRKGSGKKGSAGYELKLAIKNGSELNDTLFVEDMMSDLKIDPSLVRGRAGEILNMYCQGYTLKEIGMRYGCSESRICQILSDAVAEYQVLTIVPRRLREWVSEYAFKSRK